MQYICICPLSLYCVQCVCHRFWVLSTDLFSLLHRIQHRAHQQAVDMVHLCSFSQAARWCGDPMAFDNRMARVIGVVLGGHLVQLSADGVLRQCMDGRQRRLDGRQRRLDGPRRRHERRCRAAHESRRKEMLLRRQRHYGRSSWC